MQVEVVITSLSRVNKQATSADNDTGDARRRSAPSDKAGLITARRGETLRPASLAGNHGKTTPSNHRIASAGEYTARSPDGLGFPAPRGGARLPTNLFHFVELAGLENDDSLASQFGDEKYKQIL
ncbi:hypothetical protein EVAR_41985_1 [Eumeta japonica]|uniref:Uncharacterized protein n=1 Tax=Eumeta variegata TaxID=151549 RepID=A0A4C1WNJ9_EUMVA|nr:hypothetical protein EVAR_41985_1 [Eumeta japonica]